MVDSGVRDYESYRAAVSQDSIDKLVKLVEQYMPDGWTTTDVVETAEENHEVITDVLAGDTE